MLQDDYKKLMESFQQSIEGKPVNLEEICKESLAFFETLKAKLEQGSEEEKQETLALMAEMYQKLLQDCKRISEKTGMTEEQILALADNPAQYSSDQWRTIQETKQNMSHIGHDLAKLAHQGKLPVMPLKKPEPSEKKKSKPSSKLKKSKWMKS